MSPENAGNRPCAKRARSCSCRVIGCKNGEYILIKWRESRCDVHIVNRNEKECYCKTPFHLVTFLLNYLATPLQTKSA